MKQLKTKTQGARRTGTAVVIALLITAVGACQTNRATGESQFNLMSMDQEIEMGRDADVEISRSIGLYSDDALQRYVSALGTSIAANSEWPDLPWTFRVLDDPAVNAFALPGGFIYVTRGILAHLNSEAQLAGVLGHEIGHVTGRHSAARLSKAQVSQFGVGLAMVLEPKLQPLAPLAGAGLQLMFLSFSRSDERESDGLGVRYMVRSGYDPVALGQVMETLGRVTEEGGGGRLPQWLATHPSSENRRTDITEQIEGLEDPQEYRSDGRDDYLAAVDGTVYGADPREGYTSDGVFYHPVQRFAVTFPSGWTVVNQKHAVIALSDERDALVQLTVSGETSIGAAARVFFEMDQVDGAGVTTTRLNGLPAGVGSFEVQTDEGPIEGTVAFVELGDTIYQLVGYSGKDAWAGYRSSVDKSLRSFSALTDRRRINVQPVRLDLIRVTGQTTLRHLYDRYYGGSEPAAAIEEIALINQLEPGSVVASGTWVKMVR
jgi:predicted Zn-dependent protease